MRLKILSWNIWCDGDFSKMKKFLQSTDADIIGLQEVLPRSKKIPVVDFFKSLGYEYAYAPSFAIQLNSGEREEMGNAIFSKYPIRNSKIHTLSGGKKRVAIEANIETLDGPLSVFSVHLTHTHQLPSEEQDQQVQNLIKNLPKERLIVVGDFNATPASNCIKKMREVLNDADPNDTPTWGVYPEGCSVCKPDGVNTRLDYFFSSRDIKVLSHQVQDSTASDHLPITALIELDKKYSPLQRPSGNE